MSRVSRSSAGISAPDLRALLTSPPADAWAHWVGPDDWHLRLLDRVPVSLRHPLVRFYLVGLPPTQAIWWELSGERPPPDDGPVPVTEDRCRAIRGFAAAAMEPASWGSPKAVLDWMDRGGLLQAARYDVLALV